MGSQLEMAWAELKSDKTSSRGIRRIRNFIPDALTIYSLTKYDP
jgi:hypothetical protein